MDLRALIRDIPDFPIPGILFRDITPLLADPRALGEVTALLAERYRPMKLDKIVAIESRGFIFGAPLAVALGVGLVPARKPGKLPFQTVEESYDLEYGKAALTLHVDAILPGERVLVIDDVIATGGTLAATCRLVERLGGLVAEVMTVVELTGLAGKNLIEKYPYYSLVRY